MCPFCEKVRIVLAAKNLTYQAVEVDMRYKPAWFVELGGTVPVLEFPDGRVLNDSKLIMATLEAEHQTGYSVVPADEAKRQLIADNLAVADGIFKTMYPIVQRKDYVEDEFKALREALARAEEFINANSTSDSPFALGGENPSLLDVHLYAPLTRIEYFKGSVYESKFWAHVGWDSYTRLVRLVEAIRARPELQGALSLRRPQHYQWEKASEITERLPLFLPVVYV